MGLFSDGTEIINGGALLEGGIPTGTVVPWTKSTIATGFLECNGAAVSRTTYSALFAIVGTTYGAGDGSTTFNVPDLADNVPVGKSNNKALASTGGANTTPVTASGNIAGSTANASLSTGQLASHNHNYNPSQTSGTFDPASHIGSNRVSNNQNSQFTIANTGSGQGHPHNMSANFSGSTVNPSILQPYLTLIYIIKT